MYFNLRAMTLAVELFPQPEFPSIAITIFFIFIIDSKSKQLAKVTIVHLTATNYLRNLILRCVQILHQQSFTGQGIGPLLGWLRFFTLLEEAHELVKANIRTINVEITNLFTTKSVLAQIYNNLV
jgi:hypothetical protein